ncbi:MAG: LOG family protein [Oligoflexales bacterium]|nr:LOG family protein [Oligoflexales bacterium]
MKLTKKEVRKTLNKKIFQLNDIIADIDSLLTRMETDFFRVSIFGSARLKADTEAYQMVYDLAKQLALKGVDIVTGGGPGLMDAANKGAKDGGTLARSIGLPIELPFEVDANLHLDVKRQHRRFSSRLDEFMRISHAVVVTPGGIGTLLELFYTWQLIQVKHIRPRPILLLGGEKMWPDLMKWIKKWPLEMNLLSEKDMENIVFCKSVNQAINILKPEIEIFQKRAAGRERNLT